MDADAGIEFQFKTYREKSNCPLKFDTLSGKYECHILNLP